MGRARPGASWAHRAAGPPKAGLAGPNVGACEAGAVASSTTWRLGLGTRSTGRYKRSTVLRSSRSGANRRRGRCEDVGSGGWAPFLAAGEVEVDHGNVGGAPSAVHWDLLLEVEDAEATPCVGRRARAFRVAKWQGCGAEALDLVSRRTLVMPLTVAFPGAARYFYSWLHTERGTR